MERAQHQGRGEGTRAREDSAQGQGGGAWRLSGDLQHAMVAAEASLVGHILPDELELPSEKLSNEVGEKRPSSRGALPRGAFPFPSISACAVCRDRRSCRDAASTALHSRPRPLARCSAALAATSRDFLTREGLCTQGNCSWIKCSGAGSQSSGWEITALGTGLQFTSKPFSFQPRETRVAVR